MKERRSRGDIILDRRRASRTPVHFDVHCNLAGTSFEGTCRNLTVHGLFVETEGEVPSGASLELALHLPDAEEAPAKVSVEVRRPARRRDEGPGFGADFVELDETTATRIRETLESIRQRGFGSE